MAEPAHDSAGTPATIEIQVKRSIRFTAGDEVFAAVMVQAVEATKKPGFWDARHELAVAAARTSRKADGPYQDVLKWARELESAAAFFGRLNTKGAANDDHRNFVEAFRKHVETAGGDVSDEGIWRLLSRFQILVFDYTALHSTSEELSAERAARVLTPEDAGKASALWKVLIERAVSIAAEGGSRNRASLAAELAGFQLAGDPQNVAVRAALAASSRDALADIGDRVGNVSLARSARIARVHEALDQSRYLEIRGDAGVGKSGILKMIAEVNGMEASVVVLSPNRTIPRGWLAMRGALAFSGASAKEPSADGRDAAATRIRGQVRGQPCPMRPQLRSTRMSYRGSPFPWCQEYSSL